MSKRPSIKDDPMYQLLRQGKIKEFNRLRAEGRECDLTYADLRGLDLRGMDARGLDFSGSYFRQSDLRGIDFTKSNLEGASINGCKVSGAYFPHCLHADEITMSLVYGTRLRYPRDD